jgi:hypothetical protein
MIITVCRMLACKAGERATAERGNNKLTSNTKVYPFIVVR